MNRTFRAFPLFLCMAIAASSVFAQDKEPTHDGKTLSEWIKLLKAKEMADRHKAAEAIAAIGPKAEAAVPALREALKDEKDKVRRAVAKALGEIGAKAKDAVPDLVEALKDEKVRLMAGGALKKIDPEAAKKAGVK